jgi:hypothetical protein
MVDTKSIMGALVGVLADEGKHRLEESAGFNE